MPGPTQINLVVADVVRSGEFYRDLGWDVGEPVDPHAEIRFDGLSVELDEHSSVAFWNSGSPDDDAAATVLSIHLGSRDEVDAVWARMTGLGHESRQRPFDAFFGSRFAVLADPDGHQIGLLSPRSDEHRSDPPQRAPAGPAGRGRRDRPGVGQRVTERRPPTRIQISSTMIAPMIDPMIPEGWRKPSAASLRKNR